MTDVLPRPVAPPPAAPPAPVRLRGGSVALYGVVAAVWTAGIGLLILIAVAVGAWFAADSGTFGDAIRVGGLAWLVGNGSGLQLRDASVTLVPLGAVLVNGWMLARAGRWVGSHASTGSWRGVATGASALAGGYAGMAAIVSFASHLSSASTSLVRSVLGALVLAGVCGAWGVLRETDRLNSVTTRLPELAVSTLAGATGGLLLLLAAGGALLTASLISHFATAVRLAEGMHAGLVGGAIVTLISLALVPNAVVFAGAFLAGPGFAVGTGTVVAPGDVSTGPLPGLPLLAAVPRTPGSPWLEAGLLVLPALAGAAAGLIAVRRAPRTSLSAAGLYGGLAGLTTGVAFGLLALLSAGSVGPGRMTQIGPGASVLLVASLCCAVGGALAAVGSYWLHSDRRGPGSQHSAGTQPPAVSASQSLS